MPAGVQHLELCIDAHLLHWIALQALTAAKTIAAELHGKAPQHSHDALRPSSPSPDILYIRAVMAILQCCFRALPRGSGADHVAAASMRAHVCWVLGTVRGLLQMQAVEHVAQTLQACILAACHWHANQVAHWQA